MAKVLLVLGNGFDLKCGLKSSFPQYLSSGYYKSYIKILKSLDNDISNYLRQFHGNKSTPIYDNYDIDFKNLIFWDMYFGLPYYFKYNNIEEWYAFENKLGVFIESLIENTMEYKEIIEIDRRAISKYSYCDEDYKRKILLFFYLRKKSPFFDKKNIDKILFEELMEYEKRFGKYVRNLQLNKKDYFINANNIIEKMLDKNNSDEVVYINNFNYTDLSTIVDDVWHINGNYLNPIFGVDYPNLGPDNFEKYKYTKTYRRLVLSGDDKYAPQRKDYSKVIVFGHSLNSQDYSYFYALFNSLNLRLERNDKRKGYYIEFIYSKYNSKSSEEVRQEIVSRVLKLFYAYNQEVLHEQNFRLIDILFSTGAIRFREI